jgi:hypothetical protein
MKSLVLMKTILWKIVRCVGIWSVIIVLANLTETANTPHVFTIPAFFLAGMLASVWCIFIITE